MKSFFFILVCGMLLSSLLVISCDNSSQKGSKQLPTFDMNNLPKISEVRLTDLGFVDIKYIPLESKEQSYICDLNGIFSSNKLVVGDHFFLFKCGNNIIKFRKDGSFETKIGTIGRGPNEFTVAHDVTIDSKTNNIYVLSRWQKKIFVYNELGGLIRIIQLSNSPSGLVKCNDGILCYSENYMGNIINSFDFIDTTGAIIKSFINKYPFKNRDAYNTSGENLFYDFRDQVYSKQIYSDTIYKYNEGEFIPHLVIQVGDKLLTPVARSNFEGMYLGEHYIRPQNIFEFSDYLYYDFCYSVKIPNDILVYRFVGSKKSLNYSLLNFDEGIINDLDGGPNILPLTKLNDNTIIAMIDALKFKSYIDSESFKRSNPKYPDKKGQLELMSKNIKETDNSIIIIVSFKKIN